MGCSNPLKTIGLKIDFKEIGTRFLELIFTSDMIFTSDVYTKKCPTLSLKNVGRKNGVGHNFTSDVHAKKCPTNLPENARQNRIKVSDEKTRPTQNPQNAKFYILR